MKLFRKLRKPTEKSVENISGMDRFNGEVFDLEPCESKTMPAFIKDSEIDS